MNGLGFANPRMWSWLAIAAIGAWLVWLLSPILAPFLAGAIIAYVLNPLVNRLEPRIGRTAAVILVMLLALVVLVGLMLVVLPLFYKEARMMFDRLPDFLTWLNNNVAPLMQAHLGVSVIFDLESAKLFLTQLVQTNRGLVQQLLGSLQIGGLAVLGFLINLLLVPVVLFYLLRDWNDLLARIERVLPRGRRAQILQIAGEIDAVLAEFLRGQLLVIVVMVLFYSGALWLTDLDFALPIGVITGGLVFIPYVGAFIGTALGTVAALLQFDTFAGVLFVWVAFGAGQALEGMLVTPMLVGKRIGLHPVAVIFALLAFGQVFGFFGVLLALPASAALLVGMRHMGAAYLASPLYGKSPDAPRGDEGK
ncbi:MAG: AI-2E family transporter [Proteobacteria bacterium]|nr:AI-2E family transporter [Pseudomonadota bacterium]